MTKQELADFCRSEFERLDILAENILQATERGRAGSASLELAAVETFFHYFYSGVEDIIREILLFDGISDPGQGDPQHRILKTAGELGIIPPDLFKPLSDLLAFRTAFVLGKTRTFGWEDMEPLISALPAFRDTFHQEVSEYLAEVEVD